jgi:Na+/H+-dicarboxylate symporter
VTDFSKCLDLYDLDRNNLTYTLSEEFSSNASYVSCSDVQQYFQEMNLSCANATIVNRRFISVGNREGMNVLGIIVFTIAFGIVLGRQGEEGRKIVHAIEVLNTVVMKLVSLVMW